MELSEQADEALREGRDAVASPDGAGSSLLSHLGTALSRGSLIVVLVALVAVFAGVDGTTFFSVDNLRVVLTTQSTYGVIALAVTVALVAGEVDLSVGGVMGTAAGVAALLSSKGVAALPAIVVALLLAGAFGLVNGLLITYGRLSSIIATLATGTIATGVGLAIVGPGTISGLSRGLLSIFATYWSGIGTAFYILVALVVVGIVVLQRTLLGRRLFFVGQNRDAAALLGIKVRRLTIGAMIVTSMLAGFAGVMLCGQNGAANVTQTSGYLLPAFAAAYLGTSAFIPGRFNSGGTFVATYVLGAATVGLNMAGVATWSSYIFNGVLLIVSLGMFTVLKLRKERLAKRQSMRAAARSVVVGDD
jgi:ribose transport system permease protein